MSISDAKTYREQPSLDRVRAIIGGMVDVAAMDLNNRQDAADFDAAVRVAPDAVLGQLDAQDVLAQELIYLWVKKNPANILLLAPNQLFPEILEIFFADCMKKTRPADITARPFVLNRALDGYYVLDYAYITRPGEEIRYFDEEKGIPVSLASKLQVRIKIYDMQKFLTALDLDLAYLTYNHVARYISDLILNAYRNILTIIVDKRQVSYYSLNRYYSNIADSVRVVFDSTYDEHGIVVTDFQIRDISPLGETLREMERKSFELSKMEQQLRFEQRKEAISLEIYERKAAIHGMYPNFPIGMTELEKDRALDRYIRKMKAANAIANNLPFEEEPVAEEVVEETEEATDSILTEDFINEFDFEPEVEETVEEAENEFFTLEDLEPEVVEEAPVVEEVVETAPVEPKKPVRLKSAAGPVAWIFAILFAGLTAAEYITGFVKDLCMQYFSIDFGTFTTFAVAAIGVFVVGFIAAAGQSRKRKKYKMLCEEVNAPVDEADPATEQETSFEEAPEDLVEEVPVADAETVEEITDETVVSEIPVMTEEATASETEA